MGAKRKWLADSGMTGLERFDGETSHCLMIAAIDQLRSRENEREGRGPYSLGLRLRALPAYDGAYPALAK